MAGTEQLDVTFHGIGGHGSAPQGTKDPVVMAAMAIVQYQTIISRMIDPSKAAVLTVGAVHGGVDANVIPDEVLLRINLRFFDNEVHQQLVGGITAVNNGIARTYGMPESRLPDMHTRAFSTPLVNSAALIERLVEMLERADGAGAENLITNMPPITASEDAHLLVDAFGDVDVGYLFIGSADPGVFAQAQAAGKGIPFGNHTPFYQVDLGASPIGSKVAALAVLELLKID